MGSFRWIELISPNLLLLLIFNPMTLLFNKFNIGEPELK